MEEWQDSLWQEKDEEHDAQAGKEQHLRPPLYPNQTIRADRLREEKNEKKETIDIIKISLNIDEDKYVINIYSSKDQSTIIFKIEQEKIQTFYFYEKFDLRDFKQKVFDIKFLIKNRHK